MKESKKPATPKKLSRQVVRGQQGVNLIERIALAMHCTWTPTGATEVGIDGYIELFDPGTQHPLGKSLGVQSKVNATFSNESEDGFDYYCAERDLQYWLQGNLPVLLIVSRPEKGEAYWLSVKDYFNTPEKITSKKAHFAKATQRFDEHCLASLVQLGRSAAEGLYLGPARTSERLISNLLTLREFPQTLWIADTSHRRPQDLWPLLDGHKPRISDDWLLHESKVYSFQDLHSEPWASICDQGTCDSFQTHEWAFSSDPDRRRRFVELLNRTLKDQLYPHVRYFPRAECFGFFANLESAPLKWGYRSLKRRSSMTVVAKYSKKSRDGRQFTWLRHLAFRRQFRLFEEQWYLEITPTYVFTWDGVHLDRFHEQRLKTIKMIEKNRAVLAAIVFWSDYLKTKEDLLYSSTLRKLKFGDLMETSVEVGIDDDAWTGTDEDLDAGSSDFPDDLLTLLPEL
jgi:hypothetical protein